MRKPTKPAAPYQPKTVLAPNAPWPGVVATDPEAKPKRVPKPPSSGKGAKIDANFAKWLSKAAA